MFRTRQLDISLLLSEVREVILEPLCGLGGLRARQTKRVADNLQVVLRIFVLETIRFETAMQLSKFQSVKAMVANCR